MQYWTSVRIPTPLVIQYLTLCTSTRAQYNFGMRLTVFSHTWGLCSLQLWGDWADRDRALHTTRTTPGQARLRRRKPTHTRRTR